MGSVKVKRESTDHPFQNNKAVGSLELHTQHFLDKYLGCKVSLFINCQQTCPTICQLFTETHLSFMQWGWKFCGNQLAIRLLDDVDGVL